MGRIAGASGGLLDKGLLRHVRWNWRNWTMQPQSPEGGSPREATLLQSALLLDLEVSHQGKILKIGAVIGNHTFCGSGASLPGRAEWLRMLERAGCIIGHNLLRHDLRVLRESAPGHPLLGLPVIDTLVLSPIAFPENPYHRLVKDYKLVSESVNDPVADARQGAVLFRDEFRSLEGMRQTEPRLFELLHFLLAAADDDDDVAARGMELVFAAAGGLRPPEEKALELCRALFRQWACASVAVDHAMVQTSQARLTLAFTVTWLRVAGSNSVLPPWVRMEHPGVGALIRRLREVPCQAADCAYCRRVHNSREQLRSFFGLNDFRPAPRSPRGGSLQQEIVEAGLRNESLLAILPTGGGKSLCYQLPALVRNYRRGVLTIVISPLQALMKDQIDGLARRTSTPFAAALYGLLTPPERGDVLRRVRLGDVAVLYVSPEQLRNRSFRQAIAQREIGCWVFDEAHCLSKWGHDFRPDYLYAGRFIREFSKSHGGDIPAIACFTATAKRDVKEEILEFFKTETGRELALYEGGVERDNLRFEVQTITGHGKLERIHDLLSDRFRSESGSAIVFRAVRAATRETSEYLQAKGWKAAHFHAGLTAPEKKRVQDEFLAGSIQVICATNAFGMGIDKEDVRLVIHADTPGSLENYLQEAGRAGRDRQKAECVLLYDEEDCERQFRMGAYSELTRRDIAQILRALRKASRNRDEVVITSGEILRDEDIETSIALEETNADTKVRTAISWLERAGFVQRDENVTSVFQARPLVRNIEEAESIMTTSRLSRRERALWTAILRELMNAGSGDSLTVDQLAALPEFVMYASAVGSRTEHSGKERESGEALREAAAAYGERARHDYVSAKILRILRNMSDAGLLKRDTLLNAFVRYQVAEPSRWKLDQVIAADRKLVDVLSIEEPDAEGWMVLSLRLLNQRLCDEGVPSSVELVRKLLKSLSEDGLGFAGSHGSIELKYRDRECYNVRVRRSWTLISELAEKRRRVASLVLDVLLAKVPTGAPACADLLVEFSFEELHAGLERDGALRSELKDIDAAIERALMYLHEQGVIVLQQGLAVFRSAMTIRLQPQAKGEKYKASDFQPLQHHYRERIFQVHVMSEFARRGLERIQEALALVLAYFSLEKEDFIRRFLGTKPELLEHATTARSFQRIVTDLGNSAQMKVVTAPADRNLLVLAGPGSGKTRTVVHRCAYLLRVERVRPQSVLVCCFNRNAAIELRRRLAGLVGTDARGVTVLTYHSLAMRLLGYSFAGQKNPQTVVPDLDALIPKAVDLLRGISVPVGLEANDVRDRLLAGFQHILVDEYQDIDEAQYELISAIAGRTLDDAELRLSILAVGDDDQNIYSFRGANVRFIRRFQEDYSAEVHYLVENYRSTRYIIAAANELIAANRDRMKIDQPIRIDGRRELHPAGGDFGLRDREAGGKVQVFEVRDERAQARTVIAELRRLHRVGGVDWSNMAVLSRTHRELARVRLLAEQEKMPVRWWAERSKMPPLHQVREIQRFLKLLGRTPNLLVRAPELIDLAGTMQQSAGNPWVRLLDRMLESWRVESDDAELPMSEALEFLYEYCAESRRDFTYGDGVTLTTVHAAKGTEHDHVLLIGAWPLDGLRARQEEVRRTFYVGMTRARQTLGIIDQKRVRPSLPGSLSGPAVMRRSETLEIKPEDQPVINYSALGLEDIHLGYAGYFERGHAIHQALASLEPGARLRLQQDDRGIGLWQRDDICVARLSRKAETVWLNRLRGVCEVRLVAMVSRRADQEDDADRAARFQVAEWELPLVEIVFAEAELELPALEEQEQ